jgi:hypothetical protein
MTTDNFFVLICKTDRSKPIKQEVNGTMILPPLVFTGEIFEKIKDPGFAPKPGKMFKSHKGSEI